MKRAILITCLLLANCPLISICHAAQLPTAKEIYELQEHCGKQAAAFHNKEFGSSGIVNTKDGQAIAGYTNHYNSKLNKCFVLQTYRNIPYKDKTQHGSIMYELFDINENKGYGSYFKDDDITIPINCNVGDQICHSQKEFDALVKSYMEEWNGS